jgi:hypothetical protein
MHQSLKNGFALFPLLLATITVVMSGSIAAMLMTGNDQLASLQRQVAAARSVENAVMGFLIAYARLPCPDTDNDGYENCPSTDPSVQIAGAVPYKTLGLAGKRVLNLAYSPYIGTGSDKNLTANTDTVRVALPGEMPLLDLSAIPSPAIPVVPVVDPVDPQQALDILTAMQALENFRADLLRNDAVSISGSFVPNKVDAISTATNYMRLLSLELQTDIVINGDIGDEELTFSGPQGVDSASERHIELVEMVGDLWRYFNTVTARRNVFSDSLQVQIMQNNLKVLVDSGVSTADKVVSMRLIVNDWRVLLAGHNVAVDDFNARTAGSLTNPALSLEANAYLQLEDEDLTSIAYSDPAGALDSFDYDTLRLALGTALASTGNSLQSNIGILGTIMTDVTEDISVKIPALTDSYVDRIAAADIQVVSSTAYAETSALGRSESEWLDRAATYTMLKTLYQGLWTTMGHLNDEFYCRALNGSGSCIPDVALQQYLDAIAAESPPAPMVAPYASGFTYDTDPVAADLAGPPYFTRGIQAVVYPPYLNMADFCQKLESIIASVSPELKFTEGASFGRPAFLLIETGSDFSLDGPNDLSLNGGIFAAPDRAQNLLYDDRVRPMTAKRLSITLGCTPLLQSFESFANTVTEIDLLYSESGDILDGAQQKVITGGISVSLATVRLAVDAAAIAKDSAGGAAATVACIASLGFAVNFCISAGFQFSAAVAHGASLAGDAIALGQAIAALSIAVETRDDAKETLASMEEHYGALVSAALAVDGRGGVDEAAR